MSYHNIALIPLRGGSQSIPFKNIKPLHGRPLVFWVLDATVRCTAIERIFVATDNGEIANVVKSYGSSKIEVIGRSITTVTDTAPIELILLEFAAIHDFENIALIQATSPLLQTIHLEAGFQRLAEAGIDSVLSVVRQKRFVWEQRPNNLVSPCNYDPAYRPRRQDFEGFWVENGAFYITSKELLVRNKCRISGNISYVAMPEETYFEMDEPADWIIAEALMKKDPIPHQTLLPPSTTITAPFTYEDALEAKNTIAPFSSSG